MTIANHIWEYVAVLAIPACVRLRDLFGMVSENVTLSLKGVGKVTNPMITGQSLVTAAEGPGILAEKTFNKICAMVKVVAFFLGMGDGHPTFNDRNPYFMGPKKPLRTWVDFPIPYYMEIIGV